MAATAGPKSATISNADVRSLFLSSAIRKCQWTNPSQSPATGTTLSCVLPKAGIARALLVTVSLPITVGGSGTPIPSPKAPYNLFTNCHLQDYSGIDRVNASVYMLSQLNILKKRMWEPSSSYPYALPGSQATTDPFVAASYPSGVTAPYSARTNEGGGPNSFSATSRWNVATATGNLVFSFWVPVAFDMNDTRGAVLLNVPNGQVVLQLSINNNLLAATGIDTPYQSATATVAFNSPTTSNIYVYCYYFDPIAVPGLPQSQYPGSLPIPYADLQLVHEVRELTVPNFFTASAESIFTLMSGRDYYAVLGSVVDGSSSGPNATAGSMLTSKVTRSRFIYDGNTPTLDEYTAAHLARSQYEIGRELNEGTFALDFRNRPWDSNSYGSLGWGLTASSTYTTTSPAYLSVLTDALYLATMANA